jgi:hypothetical protein
MSADAMRASIAVLLPFAILVAACDAGPELVYVPEAPPEVTLIVAASTRDVAVGQPVVLHAERLYRGKWKQVDRAALPEGQCWVAQPPPAREADVADNVHWQVTPREGARFNVAFRADHSREVTFARPGTYTVNATTAIWCGANTGATASPFTIQVRP